MKASFLAPSLLLVALLFTGCGGGEDVTFVDDGPLCLGVGDGVIDDNSIPPDQPFGIQVSTRGCFSSSCSELREARCQVTLDDNELIVESYLEVRDTYGSGIGACTDDCRSYVAVCTAPALPEGTYTLRHGDETLEITVPDDEPHCEFF